MPRINRKRSLKKRQKGSGYSQGSSVGYAPIPKKQRGGHGHVRASPADNVGHLQKGGRKRKLSKKRALSRRHRKSLQRESFLSTLNQMGGFIRDGSTQFFKILDKANSK